MTRENGDVTDRIKREKGEERFDKRKMKDKREKIRVLRRRKEEKGERNKMNL